MFGGDGYRKELTLIAALFVIRGLVGTYFMFLDAGAQGNLLEFAVIMLGIAGVLRFFGGKILQRDTIGWAAGLTVSLTYLLSDLIQTAAGNPQHVTAFATDIILISYLVYRRDIFHQPQKSTTSAWKKAIP